MLLLVGLTGLDLNLCARLISYRQKSLSTPNNTTHEPQTSSAIYVDEYGEIARRKITQPQKRLLNAEISDIIVGYENGLSTYVLAEKYGCNRKTISAHLKKNGVTVTKAFSAQGKEEIANMYQSGLTVAEIAKQLKANCSTIIRHLHANGVQMRTRWDY